ncbi:MAG: AAA family ATPase [Burkholderiales bacterium]|nr:AAA family ATPase [Burkholderiales bacterium]
MYIEKLVIHNFGAIDKFELDKADLINLDGNPKPIILLGKNGSGKTTLMSSIADSFFEIAQAAGFNDVLPKSGSGYSYFKVSGGLNQKLDKDYGLCYFKYNNDLQYVNKSGELTIAQYKAYTNEANPFAEGFTENENIKLNNTRQLNSDKKIQNDFFNNTYLYFPSDRFEYPHWMNENFINETFEDNTIYNGKLGKKILIRDNLKYIKQWIIDVVLDSRAEIGIRTPQIITSPIMQQLESILFTDPRSINDIRLLQKSKSNIERIISAILGQLIKINLGIRSQVSSPN